MNKILSRLLDTNHLVKAPKNEPNLRMIGKKLYMLKLKLGRKNLSLELQGDAIWETDSEILHQILIIWITNAVLYTEENGGVSVEIKSSEVIVKNAPAKINDSLNQSSLKHLSLDRQRGMDSALYLVKHFADSLHLVIDLVTSESLEVVFVIKRKDNNDKNRKFKRVLS